MRENPLDLILSKFGDRLAVKAMNQITNPTTLLCLPLFRKKISSHHEKQTSCQVWPYSQADWGHLCNFFREVAWCKIIHNTPAKTCSAVTETILEGMNRFILTKRLIRSPSNPSWWTLKCTAVVCSKQHSWKRFRKHPSNQNEES